MFVLRSLVAVAEHRLRLDHDPPPYLWMASGLGPTAKGARVRLSGGKVTVIDGPFEGCLPSALGARVRRSDGKVSVTDGPFTEAKEVVGGFVLLRANSKQEAIELARQFLQVAGDGECEIRQLYEAGQNTCTDAAA